MSVPSNLFISFSSSTVSFKLWINLKENLAVVVAITYPMRGDLLLSAWLQDMSRSLDGIERNIPAQAGYTIVVMKILEVRLLWCPALTHAFIFFFFFSRTSIYLKCKSYEAEEWWSGIMWDMTIISTIRSLMFTIFIFFQRLAKLLSCNIHFKFLFS